MASEILKLRNILVEVQSLWVWESSPLLYFFPRNYLLHGHFHFLPIDRILKNKASNDRITLFMQQLHGRINKNAYLRTQPQCSLTPSLFCYVWSVFIRSGWDGEDLHTEPTMFLNTWRSHEKQCSALLKHSCAISTSRQWQHKVRIRQVSIPPSENTVL